MPRGRPKGSKNKTDAFVPDEPVHFKSVAHAAPKGLFFNSTKNMVSEMLEERKTPVVVPPGTRRVSFSGFDILNCHRLAKMLMTKYGYKDPSMPKPKKGWDGWHTFEITEPKASK